MFYVIFDSAFLNSMAINVKALNSTIDHEIMESFYSSSGSYSFLNSSDWVTMQKNDLDHHWVKQKISNRKQWSNKFSE